MAQRPVWEGHLRLSLVACPVSLFSATTTANDVRFHLINPATNNRVRPQLVDPDTGEIERKSVVRGFEIEKDQYVLLTDEEIQSVRLESTRTLDIERFVDAASIDRIWWNDPYFLVPDGKAGVDAFVVIRTAMEEAGKIFAKEPGVRFASSTVSALDGADALIIVTEWKEFRRPDFDDMKRRLKTPVVFDGRNLYDPMAMRDYGIEYFSMGRP